MKEIKVILALVILSLILSYMSYIFVFNRPVEKQIFTEKDYNRENLKVTKQGNTYIVTSNSYNVNDTIAIVIKKTK